MPKFSAVRKHEIQTGHRVYGHEGQCGNLHGHSYVFDIYCLANSLDNLGMVIDFSVIKNTICNWLDDNYDHRMLLWKDDPLAKELVCLDPSVVIVPYNPTAENIAHYILTIVAPQVLHNINVKVTKVVIKETARCSASCEL
ncbi:MAG: 6-pyruvoyl tetrahydrobiopterin synthase [Burkholderiales bacterium]|jgi:6-pyruvoyltetrahydropterin/6-carboxytetrahydropterin synthase|nr:6-pyruvoyl tetrahydrobiopterin synthase [Burkholderiales bacterium]